MDEEDLHNLTAIDNVLAAFNAGKKWRSVCEQKRNFGTQDPRPDAPTDWATPGLVASAPNGFGQAPMPLDPYQQSSPTTGYGGYNSNYTPQAGAQSCSQGSSNGSWMQQNVHGWNTHDPTGPYANQSFTAQPTPGMMSPSNNANYDPNGIANNYPQPQHQNSWGSGQAGNMYGSSGNYPSPPQQQQPQYSSGLPQFSPTQPSSPSSPQSLWGSPLGPPQGGGYLYQPQPGPAVQGSRVRCNRCGRYFFPPNCDYCHSAP